MYNISFISCSNRRIHINYDHFCLFSLLSALRQIIHQLYSPSLSSYYLFSISDCDFLSSRINIIGQFLIMFIPYLNMKKKQSLKAYNTQILNNYKVSGSYLFLSNLKPSDGNFHPSYFSAHYIFCNLNNTFTMII